MEYESQKKHCQGDEGRCFRPRERTQNNILDGTRLLRGNLYDRPSGAGDLSDPGRELGSVEFAIEMS